MISQDDGLTGQFQIISGTEMVCPICSKLIKPAFTATVLDKYAAQLDNCDSCGFLRVRQPFWLPEAYSSAIASTDTGLVQRNTNIARILAVTLYFAMGERGRGRYLDAAGGYGLLTRLMRDYGFDFYWSDKYCENLMARGFEFSDALGTCEAVTAFEVMEHLENPAQFVSEALARTRSDTFIFTTELFEGTPPAPDEWWYYSLESGQHIAFFQRRTLQTLANRLGMRFYSSGGLHILTRKTISSGMLRLCLSRASHLFAPVARRLLGSRAIADHREMVGRLRSGNGAIK